MATPKRKKWSAQKLAYTQEQRTRIMACIQRLNGQEKRAVERAVFAVDGQYGDGKYTLPNPHLRQQIRAWYRERWEYLIGEYEKVLPHVDELP